MEFTLIRILDAILDESSDKSTRLYLPTVFKRADIETICPNITSKGKLYKNISIIKTYSGDSHTIVGNYKAIGAKISNKYTSKNIGFK